MSVVIKTTEMQYRDANGVYHGINAVAEKKIADQEAALDQIIAGAQGAVNDLETQSDTFVAAINQMLQTGTDPTLSRPNVAADAAACGDLESALNSGEINLNEIRNGFSFGNADLFIPSAVINGKAYNLSSHQVTNLNNYGYLEVIVPPNTDLVLSGLSESFSSYGYRLTDRDGNILKEGGETNNMRLYMPSNAYKILFSIKLADINNMSIKIKQLDGVKWAMLPNGVQLFNSAEIITEKAWRTDVHKISDAANSYGYVGPLLVIPGAKVDLSGFSEKMTIYGCAFVGADGTVIEEHPTLTQQQVTVPSGALYFYASLEVEDANNISIYAHYDGLKTLPKIVREKLDLIPNGTELFESTKVVQGYAWSTVAHKITSAASDDYGYIGPIPVVPSAIIETTGFSENMSVYGCAFTAVDGTFIEDHPTIEGAKLTVPSDAYYFYASVKTADVSDISLLEYFDFTSHTEIVIEGRLLDVVLIGDSWSDTNPEHTSYTKWPVYFEKWHKCNLHNYALNGSRVYGPDSLDYPTYTTHGGQMALAEADTSYDHNEVGLVILEGGINDFNHDATASELTSGFVSLINRAHIAFPNARVVCIMNSRVTTPQTLWEYMQTTKSGIKKATGCPAFTTFGWFPAENYINDYTHPDNDGYKYFAANMIAIADGGSPTFEVNKVTKTGTSDSGASLSLTVEESFTEDMIFRRLILEASNVTDNGKYTFEYGIADGLLSSAPFESFPDLIVESGTISNMRKGIIRGVNTPDSLGLRIMAAHGNLNGTYISQQIPIFNS